MTHTIVLLEKSPLMIVRNNLCKSIISETWTYHLNYLGFHTMLFTPSMIVTINLNSGFSFTYMDLTILSLFGFPAIPFYLWMILRNDLELLILYLLDMDLSMSSTSEFLASRFTPSKSLPTNIWVLSYLDEKKKKVNEFS